MIWFLILKPTKALFFKVAKLIFDWKFVYNISQNNFIKFELSSLSFDLTSKLLKFEQFKYSIHLIIGGLE